MRNNPEKKLAQLIKQTHTPHIAAAMNARGHHTWKTKTIKKIANHERKLTIQELADLLHILTNDTDLAAITTVEAPTPITPTPPTISWEHAANIAHITQQNLKRRAPHIADPNPAYVNHTELLKWIRQTWGNAHPHFQQTTHQPDHPCTTRIPHNRANPQPQETSP